MLYVICRGVPIFLGPANEVILKRTAGVTPLKRHLVNYNPEAPETVVPPKVRGMN